jgi:hypothetical protein
MITNRSQLKLYHSPIFALNPLKNWIKQGLPGRCYGDQILNAWGDGNIKNEAVPPSTRDRGSAPMQAASVITHPFPVYRGQWLLSSDKLSTTCVINHSWREQFV